MMGEVDVNYMGWSLIDVVNECATKAKLSAQIPSHTTTKTATTTTTKATDVAPKKSPVLRRVVPRKNSVGPVSPSMASGVSAAGAATIAAPATYGSPSGDESSETWLYPHQNSPMIESHDFIIQQQNSPLPQLSSSSSVCVSYHHYIEKRKKYDDRRIIKCTFEDLPKNDNWAWRKYGQKPIKGSPYPRSYYRCSTMKACKARKHVERSPLERGVYVITYTNHHCHPQPIPRNYNLPRIRYANLPNSKPSLPDPVQPESPRDAESGQDMTGSGSGCDGARVDEEMTDNDGSGGGDDDSFGSGGMEEKNNNNDDDINNDDYDDDEDNEILIMSSNVMAGSDLMTGMEQLFGGEKMKGNNNENVWEWDDEY